MEERNFFGLLRYYVGRVVIEPAHKGLVLFHRRWCVEATVDVSSEKGEGRITYEARKGSSSWGKGGI